MAYDGASIASGTVSRLYGSGFLQSPHGTRLRDYPLRVTALRDGF